MKKMMGTVVFVFFMFLLLLVIIFVLQKNNSFHNWIKREDFDEQIVYKEKLDGVEIFALSDQSRNDMKLAFAKQNFLSSEQLIVGDFPHVAADADVSYKYSLITFKDNTNIPVLYGFSNEHGKDRVDISYQSSGAMLYLETAIIKGEGHDFWYYILENPLSGTEVSTVEVR